MLTLISATPSPYARKVRIALALKSIPFHLQNEIPWESATKTPDYNPLEQLPILIPDDGSPAVYESKLILEYIDLKFPDKEPRLYGRDVDEKLMAKKIEVVCDGVYDAVVRLIWEKQRGDKASKEWMDRQARKIIGGTKAVGEWIKEASKRAHEYVVGNQMSVADLAVITLCDYLVFCEGRLGDMSGWKEKYPDMVAYWKRLGERKEFAETKPVMFDLKEKVV